MAGLPGTADEPTSGADLDAGPGAFEWEKTYRWDAWTIVMLQQTNPFCLRHNYNVGIRELQRHYVE